MEGVTCLYREKTGRTVHDPLLRAAQKSSPPPPPPPPPPFRPHKHRTPALLVQYSSPRRGSRADTKLTVVHKLSLIATASRAAAGVLPFSSTDFAQNALPRYRTAEVPTLASLPDPLATTSTHLSFRVPLSSQSLGASVPFLR